MITIQAVWCRQPLSRYSQGNMSHLADTAGPDFERTFSDVSEIDGLDTMHIYIVEYNIFYTEYFVNKNIDGLKENNNGKRKTDCF